MARRGGDVTVVIDNGGGTLKVGFAGDAEPVCCVPNLGAKPKGDKRLHLGDEVEALRDHAALSVRRPVDRGFVVNTPLQRDIWDRIFSRVLKINPSECSLLVTEPLFNLPALMTSLDELAFESFGFRSLVVAPAALCASLDPKAASQPGSASAVRARAALVLDLGFSATHCVPVFDARVQWSGCRRINLGGKALTNHLKELVSYRTMNMMDEFYLMDRVKERLCYVAQDLEAELSSARLPRTLNPVVREYVLPDGVSVLRGFVRGEADDPKRTARAAAAARAPRVAADANEEDEEAAAGGVAAGEQVLTIGPERFMVPEALLHPSGVGSPQAGLAEACVSAVNACGADIRGLLWSNVVLVGGGAACPGMRERLTAELRPLVPDTFSLNVSVPAQPERAAWRGASVLARSDAFQQHQLARADYLAQGGAKRDAAVHHGTTARPPPGRIW